MLTRSLQALVTLACVAWMVAPTGAQMDLSKILVGKWEGQVELQSGTWRRVLLIKSAREQDGKWAIEAQYGPKGKELAPVDVTLEKVGDEVIVKFPAAEGREAGTRYLELTLHKDGKHLLGTIQVHAGARGGSYRAAKFEKAG